MTAPLDAGQVLMAGYPEGPVPDAILTALERDQLAGVILFKRNLEDGAPGAAAQIRRLAAAAARTPLVAVDQEGGRVQRLRAPVLELPPMRAIGERDDAELTERVARALGEQLGVIGFNVNFAPVFDVDTNPDNPVIGDRSFSADPEAVARHGLAFARGLRAAGVMACGKHFPGHGDTVQDSHLALPAIAHDLDRLERVELVPFRAAAAELESIMTAHIVFQAIDPEVPATLSAPVISGLLRDSLGFEGIVVSDDLEMKAIADHFGIRDAAVRAIRAGCDLLLICSDLQRLAQAHAALVQEAAEDSGFARRLKRAADRVRAKRSELSCEPAAADQLTEALNTKTALAVRRELKDLLSATRP